MNNRILIAVRILSIIQRDGLSRITLFIMDILKSSINYVQTLTWFHAFGCGERFLVNMMKLMLVSIFLKMWMNINYGVICSGNIRHMTQNNWLIKNLHLR